MHPLERLASAIARQEGFWSHGSSIHNPGNLRASVLQRFKDPRGLVKFTSDTEGFACLLIQLIWFAALGLTLQQCIHRWAPPTGADGGNDTSTYLRNVCTWTGLTPETRLIDLIQILKDTEPT